MASASRPEHIAAMLKRAFREAQYPGVVSVYLFGSHREGRAHRESDVDVGILLEYSAYPSRRERFEVRSRLSSQLGAQLRQRLVDVVVLNEAPPLLGRRIVTTGERLFCANDDADRSFVRDVQLRAADVEPFLRRTRQVKLGAIAR